MPSLVEKVKELPDRKWNPDLKAWTVPATYREDVERFARSHRFAFNAPVVSTTLPPQVFPEIELPDLTFEIPLKGRLFDFQKKGVAYILEKKRLIVGDQMGLGKTVQAIAAVSAANAFPCLVICPASLKLNWEREWHMWTNHKAMILNDSVKRTFKLFFEAGLAKVFIVNYESLKKYFVLEMPKDTKGLTLRDITFNENKDFFKSIIIDEAHRCFPYDTKIMTNKGALNIGDIVENKLINLFVVSLDFSNKSVTLKKITNVWKNEIGQRKLFKVKHENGEFIATGNHKVLDSSGRYKEVSTLKSGDYLYELRKDIFGGETREVNPEILQQELCCENSKCKTGSESQNIRKIKETDGRKGLCFLWKRIFNPFTWEKVRKNKVLFTELFCKMESKSSGNDCTEQIGIKTGKEQDCSNKADERPRTKENEFRKNEGKQPDVKSDFQGKNESENDRKEIQTSGRKWADYGISTVALGCFEAARKLFGIFHKDFFPWIKKSSTRIQGRYSDSGNTSGDRGRREKSQSEPRKIGRSAKDGSLRKVRVESVEIYQPTNLVEYRNSPYFSGTVYDLEIEGTHNYFADNILVSNCKDPKAQQTKFTRAIADKKEWILALTGTPVVNKPKDLASQLAIINRLGEFGGWKKFVDRYEEPDTYKLRELNHHLKSICFYRRDKSEATDLPAKTRQVVVCDITTRKEYNEALKDLADYLRKYKQATDDQVARSMRGEVMVRIGILKNISARGKLEACFEFIRDTLDNGEKLILFGHLREVLGAVKKKFPSVSITGEDSTQDRQLAVDRFQKDPDVNLIVCSIAAAGVGITLTASSTVAFIEMGWHPAIMEQAEDRAHRIGQKDHVNCIYFIGRDTIDEWVYKLIDEKRSMSSAITGAKDDVEESVMDGLIDLFNQKYNLS